MEKQSEDPAATWLQEIVRQYEVPLVRYATRIVGDVERARDVVQDSFLKLCHEPRERVEPIVGRWLYTVCRNRAFDIRKKESRMKAISDERAGSCESREPSQSAASERHDSFGQAAGFLNDLPEKQCEAIRLRIHDGLSYRDIAAVMGTSVSSVGVLIHKGIQTIRQRVSQSESRADRQIQGN
ncbi:MAG: RNA polymerase sigma factor (sigma-70 family) [Pirellulaceae bacterium]|jgi:RNA polymerase sigma factor (sigma-70 family)